MDDTCMICERHVSELEEFGELSPPWLGGDPEAKLIRQTRDFLPDYSVRNLECRDCFVRPGPLWAIAEEDRLGRPLTERECIDLQCKLELSLLENDERPLIEREYIDLRYKLDLRGLERRELERRENTNQSESQELADATLQNRATASTNVTDT